MAASAVVHGTTMAMAKAIRKSAEIIPPAWPVVRPPGSLSSIPLMYRAAKTTNDIAFMRLDREFNRLMIEAAHNDYAARSMKLLQGLSRRFWYMHYRQAADLPLCARLHASQARAIAEGDRDAAARSSDRLMDYVESFTRATVAV